MLPRERIYNALDFKRVDKPGLIIDVSERGLYEHGEKLRELFKTVEGDFGPISDCPIPYPPEGTIDINGNYHGFSTDPWRVTWEYRIFKIQGHPYKRPLDDWNSFNNYKTPLTPFPAKGTHDFEESKSLIKERMKKYFTILGWTSILQLMTGLRKYDDVLAEIYEDDININKLADLICEYNEEEVANIIDLGVDAVQFADDFGMQNTMLISPTEFRRFFKPRFKKLIKPVKDMGKKTFMHCCGYALPIIEDYKEIGVDAIWPQIAVYNLKEFASFCRSIEMAVYIHPNRAELMTYGTPDDIKRTMYEYIEAFRPQEGGSMFYIEIDNGFPYENIKALVDVLTELRK
jgi:uroporphyrinogen-III decarboxylase